MCQPFDWRKSAVDRRVGASGRAGSTCMIETIHSIADAKHANARRPGLSWGMGAVAAVSLLALSLVVWIEFSTWRQMERLQDDFATANLESFFLGVHLRESVLRMNGAVYRFQLSEDESERAAFHREATELTTRLERTKTRLTTEAERQIVAEIEQSLERYRKDTAPSLARGMRGIRKESASLLHRELSDRSRALVALADRLVQAQQAALHRFLDSSQAALTLIQRLMVLSVLLLAVLGGLVVALLHRIKVAPLQARLDASREAAARQEKLASLGVLAAGVAHEVRNPLTAIKFRLFSLNQALPEGFADHEDLVLAQNEINRLERIVKEFLEFARPSEPELANVSVTQLLSEVQALLQPELVKRSIRLQLDSGNSLMVRADQQQLQQVLINLVQNAADSIERHGAITLRARPGGSSAMKQARSVITVEISDTGKGIPAEVEPRIFDPFFSTKEGGTGLGLPIAARIVEKHGGVLQYVTQPNRGTTFSIVLPKALLP